MENWTKLGLNNWLARNLLALGIKSPSNIQQVSIPTILSPDRRNFFACSRTGSGKTLAYLLPVVQQLIQDPKPYFSLILAPTRELAYQINEMIKAITAYSVGVKSLLVIGGEGDHEKQGLWFGKPNIVVATPGRLLDHFNNCNFSDVSGTVSSVHFDVLVLDEADQLISNSFCEQLRDILAFLDQKKKRRRQTLVFSATLTSALEKLTDIVSKETDEAAKPIVANLLPTMDEIKIELRTNPDLDQRYLLCAESVKMAYLIECLLDLNFKQLIIFCKTKKEAKLIHKVLLRLGFNSSEFNMSPVLLNSDMRQNLRFAALDKFKSLKSKILVTTDLANRGLDLPQVDLIINYNCPKNPVDYVHRVGRTCRKPDLEKVELIKTVEEIDKDERSNSHSSESVSVLKAKPRKDLSEVISRPYTGKSVTFVTQYDVNLFKSIESFVGLRMEKEDNVDEEYINTILRQVAVAIKEAEIRLEQEEYEETNESKNPKRKKEAKVKRKKAKN